MKFALIYLGSIALVLVCERQGFCLSPDTVENQNTSAPTYLPPHPQRNVKRPGYSVIFRWDIQDIRDSGQKGVFSGTPMVYRKPEKVLGQNSDNQPNTANPPIEASTRQDPSTLDTLPTSESVPLESASAAES